MAATFPEPRWAVPGIVAEGLTFLVGPPKVGKSWLGLGLGVSVATGGMALGSIRVEAGDVLYLALEDPPRRLQSRLGVLLGDDGAPGRLDVWTSCAPLPDGGDDEIRSWLGAHPDGRLLVVDVLAKTRGRRDPRGNGYDVDYEAGSALKAIADDFSIALVVNHHTRKATGDDFLDEVSGTQGIAGSADTVAVLRRSRGSADAVLKITGRDVEEAEHAMRFAPDLGAWQLLEGPATDYALGETRRRVLHLLRDEGPLRPKQIADLLGADHELIKKTCQRMVDADQLDTDGTGIYFVPVSPVPPVPTVPQGGDTGDARDTPEAAG
jgi:hypothetical protein